MAVAEEAMKQVKESVALDTLEEKYAAYYLPGGHGTVVDFPQSAKLQQLLGAAWDNGELNLSPHYNSNRVFCVSELLHEV